MDLLALATQDGQLCVHRLNWQRLWAITPEPPLTALCWSPDGKVLATGHQDGMVSLLDVEQGATLHSGRMVKGPVTSIGWVEEGTPIVPSNSVHMPSRAAVFLPCPQPYLAHPTSTLPEVFLASASVGQQQILSMQRWPPEPQSLDMLCIASGSALSLGTHSLFPVAGLDIMPIAGALPGLPAQVKILRASISEDLQMMYLLWMAVDQPDKAHGRVHVTVCESSLLSQRRRELHTLSLLATSLVRHLHGSESTLNAVDKCWRKAMHDVEDKIVALREIMRGHAASATPQEEFLRLLTVGHLSDSMHQFLTASLGSEGVKKLSKSVDSAVHHASVLVMDHLQPALQAAAFSLQELLGLARCSQWVQQIGLSPAIVSKPLEIVSRLQLRCETLRLAFMRVGAQYRQFFAWLLRMIMQLKADLPAGAEHAIKVKPAALAAFLKGQFVEDVIGPELETSGFFAGKGWPKSRLAHPEAHPPVADIQRILAAHAVQHSPSATIREQLSLALLHCTTGFAMSPSTMSPRIVPLVSVQMAPVVQARPGLAAVAMSLGQARQKAAAGKVLMACIAEHGGRQHVALAHVQQVVQGSTPEEQAAGTASGKIFAAALHIPTETRVLDLAFYRAGQLALLLGPASGEGEHRLALVPTQDLTWQAYDGPACVLQVCTTPATILQECIDKGTLQPLPAALRQRALPYSQVQAPMAVSAPRGVCCVLSATQRAVLYELEEDEADEELAGSGSDEENEAPGSPEC